MTESSLFRLSRTSFSQPSEFTEAQSQIDNIVVHSLTEASNPQTAGAILAGGAASRLFRLGALGLGVNAGGRTALAVRAFASAGSVVSEAMAFEGFNRGIDSLHPERINPNRWNLRGEGGLFQGVATSTITFGSLRGVGVAAQGQNIVFQHTAQSAAMVFGHNAAAAMNIIARPDGTLADQFAHAEVTNIQLAGLMGTLHAVAPGAHSLERSLDLAIESRQAISSSRRGSETNLQPWALAMANGGRLPEGTRVESGEVRNLRPEILLSQALNPKGGGGSREVPANWPANLSIEWAQVPGSNLYTSREVRDTKELNRAILEEGLLPLLNGSNPAEVRNVGERSSPPEGDAVHSIFGYGSFPLFRDGVAQDIRLWDADKKPDYIIVGNNRRMIENLANRWNLSPADRAALLDHATYTHRGFREGFVFFNTDILIPGRGPVAFKISLVDENAFFALRRGGPALEYSQIRLKDATEHNLLWSRDRPRTMGHLDAIRDQILEEAYLRGGGLWSALVRPARFFRHSFKGDQLAEWFYRLSFRIEGYRFWENGRGSWDKGAKLFRERREEARDMMVTFFRRFALRHQDTLTINGKEVDQRRIDEQITADNIYDLQFRDHGLRRGAMGRSVRYWKIVPYFLYLNLRGLSSYLRHGLPANKSSQAFYRIPADEYAGRKARNLVYSPGMTEVSLTARILAHPFTRRVPGLKKIALDSIHYPVYYTSLPAMFNEYYRTRDLSQVEYDALFNRFSSSPGLASLRNEHLLREFVNSDDPVVVRGTHKILRHVLELPFLEPSVDRYIRSLNIVDQKPPEKHPWEVHQIIYTYLTSINLLFAGRAPRMYEFLRQTLRFSLPDDSPRLPELIDYIDRSEAGEHTELWSQMQTHSRVAEPSFTEKPIPQARPLLLQPPASAVLGVINSGPKKHDENASTVAVGPSDSDPARGGEE